MTTFAPYVAPAIVERTPVGLPLVATVGSGPPESAVFRTEADYEAPAIVERTPVDLPMIGILLSGGTPSAVFRTEGAYESPAIVERTPVAMPLIGTGSLVPCAVFRPETMPAGRS